MKFLESIKSVLKGSSKKEQLDQFISLAFSLQNNSTDKVAINYLNELKQNEITPATIFSEIEKTFQKALILARELNERHTQGDILYNLGRLYQDPPRKTIVNLENLNEKEKEEELTIRLQNLAYHKPVSGNQNVAITYFSQALEIAKQEEKPVLEVSCLLNIAVANRLLGNNEQHLDYVTKASKAIVNIEDKEMKEHIKSAIDLEKLFIQKT